MDTSSALRRVQFLARSLRRKVDEKRWNERTLKIVTGTPWHPRSREVIARRRYIVRSLMKRYGASEDCWACFQKATNTPIDAERDSNSCAQETVRTSRRKPKRDSQLRDLSPRQQQHRQKPSTLKRWEQRTTNRQGSTLLKTSKK